MLLNNRATFITLTLILLIAPDAALPPSAAAQSAAPRLDVDATRIANAGDEPANWLAHGRTYDEQRFSPLDAINTENVSKLGLAWSFPTEVGRGHEASPLIVDGKMFLTLPWSVGLSLDAATGKLLWLYDPEVPRETGRNACCDVVNRGMAIWKGKVYWGTIDGRLIAADAATGEKAWEVQTTDRNQPYTITGAPRIVKDKVIIGNGGAEYGVRGYFTAYDAATGDELWRFYTVPGDPSKPFENPALEAAAKTWNGEWWKMGGGGTAWDSMAYDPELDLLYVGTGNGSPWNREIRSPGGGDNLYLSSILAVRPDTGELVWHYQTTPADNWDYTATQHMILATLKIDGRDRKVIMQAPKNGFFYVLDRVTGELLSANNYVNTTWASHVDLKTGRPVETERGDYKKMSKLIFPSAAGGHNWHPMAFNPETGLVYIPVLHEPLYYAHAKDFEFKPGAWNTGVDFAAALPLAKAMGGGPPSESYLKAWDPVKGTEAWSVKHPTSGNGGVLATAGNLVFQGTAQGTFVAYDARNGEKLWETETNVGIIAPPVSYAVNGEQHVAVLAGWGGVPGIIGGGAGVAAPSSKLNRGQMFAFKLGGTAPMPVIESKRVTAIPPPPDVPASPDEIRRGERLYHQHCFQCHGLMAVQSGVITDLRYSSSAVHKNYRKILLEGALKNVGMASFDDVLNEADADAIHAYVVSRQKQDYEAQEAAGTE